MYGVLLLLHILAATVWTGGHLVLALTVLPRALKEHSCAQLLWFESGYERIGVPSLLIQVITGAALAHRLIASPLQWFDFSNPLARLICMKLGLLAMTLGLAADARLRIIPKLSPQTLCALAWHIVPVTVASVLFVLVGVSFRTGWLY